MSALRKLVIIGGGPGGLTAGIYASRAQLEPLMIEGIQRGGQLTTTTEVENYPGFPEGVDGTELVTMMRQQAEKFGTEFLSEDVESVDFSTRPFVVKTASQIFHAQSVIISTGAQAKYLGLDSEKRLVGKGVSVCATCDGFFFRGKDIVVVGGGDSAMEEAIFLTKFARSVKVIHRRKDFRASPIMVQRASDNEKIDFVFDSVVDEVLGEESVTGVRIRNVETDESSELSVDGVFIAIGHKPNTSLFGDQLQLDDKGYLVTTSTKTSIEGVFAAGDVQDPLYRQAATAVGTGCAAALHAQWYVEALEAEEEAQAKIKAEKTSKKKKKKKKKKSKRTK